MVRRILSIYRVGDDFLIERDYAVINKAIIYVLIICYFGLIMVICCVQIVCGAGINISEIFNHRSISNAIGIHIKITHNNGWIF